MFPLFKMHSTCFTQDRILPTEPFMASGANLFILIIHKYSLLQALFLLMYKYKFLTKLTEIPHKTAKQTKRALIKIAHFYTLIHNFIHTYSLILYIYSLYFLLQIVNFCINIQKVIHFSTFLDKLSTLKCKTNFLHLPFQHGFALLILILTLKFFVYIQCE